MKIYGGTGVTSTSNLKVTKSVQSLIVATDKTVEEFTNESITIFIERVNLANIYLATALPLADFLMLTNYGNDSIQSNATFKTIALCELAEDGAIRLNEGESLNIKIDGLNPAKNYELYAVEDADVVETFYKFDRKSIASEDTVKTISVEKAELVVIDLKSSVSEVSVKYANGTTNKHLPFELRVISRDIDGIYAINQDNTVLQGHSTRVAIPSIGVNELEIVKTAGELVTVVTRTEVNLMDL